MPHIRVKYVVSYSSQDPRHTVENLTKGSGSWLSHSSDRSGRLQADLQLERATTISFIDLGNSGSVMISVEVGRSSWPSSQPLVTLLPTVALMTPAEWRAGKNATTVRMFKQDNFNSEAAKEKWDRVRIVCTQPFRKDAQFGLALFRLHTNSEVPHGNDSSADTVVKNQDTGLSKSNSQKEELVSRMNLPAVKKKTMSQSIGWLENKILTNGEESHTNPPSNPFTSPVSRAARLVVMAAKPTKKTEADSHKAVLECEALEFLISLNLTVADINSLKVSGVRREFEKRRHKELSHEEKIIFKDIALDYAKERLNSLEIQQEKLAVRGFGIKDTQKCTQSKANVNGKENKNSVIMTKQTVYQNNCGNSNKKTTLPNSTIRDAASKTGTGQFKNAKERESMHQPQNRFKFKHVDSPGKPQQLSNSPRNISLDRQKLRDEDNLDASSSSGSSRNNLALADSRVTTPKRSRTEKSTNIAPLSANKKAQQPNLDGWFTPNSKRRKEHVPFSYSTLDIKPMSSDEEDSADVENCSHSNSSLKLETKKVEGGGFLIDPTPQIVAHSKKKNDTANNSVPGNSEAQRDSSGGYRLGSVPVDKFGISRNGSISSHSASSPGSSDPTAMAECPLCGGFFESSDIESHAASCSIVLSGSDSETDMSDNDVSAVGHTKEQEGVEECPVCGDFVSSSSIEMHASACASSAFG